MSGVCKFTGLYFGFGYGQSGNVSANSGGGGRGGGASAPRPITLESPIAKFIEGHPGQQILPQANCTRLQQFNS